MPEPERDPRTDPRVGDVLEKRIVNYRGECGWTKTREVVKILPHEVLWRGDGKEGLCFLRSWRNWAKDAVVVHQVSE